MIKSYLIQRLRKPCNSKNETLANAFAFGGGLPNGGIPKEGMVLLKEIFSFDYMGSAEFEFGAVPKALSKIANNFENLIGFTIHAPYEYKHWDEVKCDKGIKQIHIICEKEQRDEVVKRIKNFAKKDCYGDTKEAVRLNENLAKEDDDIRGWLEIDNGYFFFSDKEMFDKTCILFDITAE